jgi:hypothetical protein
MAITNEEIEGWIPNVSVAYCNNYCPQISSISMIFSFMMYVLPSMENNNTHNPAINV